MPASPFDFRIVLSLPLLLFATLVLVLIDPSSAINCQCACCIGAFCPPNPPVIGTASVSSCIACTDDFCTSEYPALCPTDRESGRRTASCTSSASGGGGDLAIWVIILIVVGALGALVVAGVVIALVIMSQRKKQYQQL